MKNLKNLGQALSKAEQKTINGGAKICDTHEQCGTQCCHLNGFCGPRENGKGSCDGYLSI